MNFLSQTKLNEEEWSSIERPVENRMESKIICMINNGYHNTSLSFKTFVYIHEYIKLNQSFDFLIYSNFFEKSIKKLNKNDILNINTKIKQLVKSFSKSKMNIVTQSTITKKDKIKFDNSIKLLENIRSSSITPNSDTPKIVEFIVENELKSFAKYLGRYFDSHKETKRQKDKAHSKLMYHLYNLHYLKQLSDSDEYATNQILSNIIEHVIHNFDYLMNSKIVLEISPKILEENYIHNYKKIQLFDHQKDIFKFFRENKHNSKMVFYCAPTSSGKTLTPIGLSNEYKVIFMCASKHIGLSLAKYAYHCKKHIGFAFGCESFDDIRLNYNAIAQFNIDKNGKKYPDHSNGSKVDIMICDVKSFIHASEYMAKFHEKDETILFWDEPTITMDYEEHPLHDTIYMNCKANKIPNIVFSSATLPSKDELQLLCKCLESSFDDVLIKHIETIDEFSNVTLYEPNKSIVMPHTHFVDYNDLKSFLKKNGSRYFKFYSLKNCVQCILDFAQFNKETNDFYHRMIPNFKTVTMQHIKSWYKYILVNIETQDKWDQFRSHFGNESVFSTDDILHIGTELTTLSSHSLTNGPTLYVTNNNMNLLKYLLLKSQIDGSVLDELYKSIEFNQQTMQKIKMKQKDYEDKIAKFKDNDKMMTDMRLPNDVLELKKEINHLESCIKRLRLDDIYVPNSRDHWNQWYNQYVNMIDHDAKQYTSSENITYENSNVFTSNMDEHAIMSILKLDQLEDIYKIMTLMGVGVLDQASTSDTNKNNNDYAKYLNIIKGQIEKKNMYLIVGNSDYIYGTNYQFSHCYLGKDVKSLTQEKIIQCIGRVGRQDRNQRFTFRFRSQMQIDSFFNHCENNMEALHLNRLFCC